VFRTRSHLGRKVGRKSAGAFSAARQQGIEYVVKIIFRELWERKGFRPLKRVEDHPHLFGRKAIANIGVAGLKLIVTQGLQYRDPSIRGSPIQKDCVLPLFSDPSEEKCLGTIDLSANLLKSSVASVGNNASITYWLAHRTGVLGGRSS
jgi:hypothetical protein